MALRDRRGVALDSHKFIGINRAIEAADYATLIGNGFDYATYAFAGKPVFQVPNPAAVTYPFPEAKDFAAARRRFLWIGSQGFVHKGLDLVLEAFARMPDHHLTVCGPLDAEPAFVAAFRRELFETPNIETLGWVDIASPAFAEPARAHRRARLPLGRRGLLRHRRQQHAGRADPAGQPRVGGRRRRGLRHDRRRHGRGGRGGGADPRGAAAGRARGDGARAPGRWRAPPTPARRYRAAFGAAIERIVAEHPTPGFAGFVRMPGAGRAGRRPALRAV